MRRLTIFLGVLLLLEAAGIAQTTFKRPQAASSQSLTVGVTAIGLSAGTLDPVDGKGKVQQCIGVVEGGPIRMRSTGSNPTATSGLLGAVNAPVTINGDDVLSKWKAILDTTATGNAKIEFECYREFRR